LARHGAPIYVRKQIVHNTHVVARLAAQGVVFVDEVDAIPVGSVVIFSAHGVSPSVRQAAADRQLQIIDATCPLVSKVHREAQRLDCPIVLIGHRGHEEVEGTMGVARNAYLIETPADVADLPDFGDQPIAWLSQTTLSVDETRSTVAALRQRFPQLIDPPSDDICYATQNRQTAARQLATRCQLVIVVGSDNSSNSRRLVEVAQTAGTVAHLVDDAGDMDEAWLGAVDSVGVTSGASVPDDLVTEVLAWMTDHGWPPAVELAGPPETLHFTLPPALTSPYPPMTAASDSTT